jgi:c-di-GMP-related signal transduction protein
LNAKSINEEIKSHMYFLIGLFSMSRALMNKEMPKNINGSFIMLEVQKMVLGTRRINQKNKRFDKLVLPFNAR